MKLQGKAVAWVLPLVLTGCFHKTNQARNQPPLAPQLEDTPPPNTPINLPQPTVTVPSTPKVTVQQQQPKPAPKHKKTPKPAPSPASSSTQMASNSVPEVPAIGTLSSGEPADLKRQTVDSIASIERGLNEINRRLSDQEQKTSTQIREFLKQARTALASGDLDGAHTLAVKAKVLLGELNQ